MSETASLSGSGGWESVEAALPRSTLSLQRRAEAVVEVAEEEADPDVVHMRGYKPPADPTLEFIAAMLLLLLILYASRVDRGIVRLLLPEEQDAIEHREGTAGSVTDHRSRGTLDRRHRHHGKVNPAAVQFRRMERAAVRMRDSLFPARESVTEDYWEYAKFREIADKCGAMLMMDMAHISGLVAAEEQAQPFEYCDIVTTTTHKSLRGPRAGMIFFRRGPRPSKKGEPEGMTYDYESRINMAVFPALQGGPHNHQIGALAVALKHASGPEFKKYQQQVKANARALASALMSKGYKLVTDGTDNHLVLWDLRPCGLTGSKMETICDMLHITLNKNAVFGDASALAPGGCRIGAPAMTSRGLKENDFEKIADFLHKAVELALEVQASHGKMLKDWKLGLEGNPAVDTLRAEVEAFAEAVIGYLKNKGVDLADPDWALGAPRRPMRRKHRADTGAMLLASDAACASRSLLPYQATSRSRFRRSTSPSARCTTIRRTPT